MAFFARLKSPKTASHYEYHFTAPLAAPGFSLPAFTFEFRGLSHQVPHPIYRSGGPDVN